MGVSALIHRHIHPGVNGANGVSYTTPIHPDANSVSYTTPPALHVLRRYVHDHTAFLHCFHKMYGPITNLLYFLVSISPFIAERYTQGSYKIGLTPRDGVQNGESDLLAFTVIPSSHGGSIVSVRCKSDCSASLKYSLRMCGLFPIDSASRIDTKTITNRLKKYCKRHDSSRTQLTEIVSQRQALASKVYDAFHLSDVYTQLGEINELFALIYHLSCMSSPPRELSSAGSVQEIKRIVDATFSQEISSESSSCNTDAIFTAMSTIVNNRWPLTEKHAALISRLIEEARNRESENQRVHTRSSLVTPSKKGKSSFSRTSSPFSLQQWDNALTEYVRHEVSSLHSDPLTYPLHGFLSQFAIAFGTMQQDGRISLDYERQKEIYNAISTLDTQLTALQKCVHTLSSSSPSFYDVVLFGLRRSDVLSTLHSLYDNVRHFNQPDLKEPLALLFFRIADMFTLSDLSSSSFSDVAKKREETLWESLLKILENPPSSITLTAEEKLVLSTAREAVQKYLRTFQEQEFSILSRYSLTRQRADYYVLKRAMSRVENNLIIKIQELERLNPIVGRAVFLLYEEMKRHHRYKLHHWIGDLFAHLTPELLLIAAREKNPSIRIGSSSLEDVYIQLVHLNDRLFSLIETIEKEKGHTPFSLPQYLSEQAGYWTTYLPDIFPNIESLIASGRTNTSVRLFYTVSPLASSPTQETSSLSVTLYSEDRTPLTTLTLPPPSPLDTKHYYLLSQKSFAELAIAAKPYSLHDAIEDEILFPEKPPSSPYTACATEFFSLIPLINRARTNPTDPGLYLFGERPLLSGVIYNNRERNIHIVRLPALLERDETTFSQENMYEILHASSPPSTLFTPTDVHKIAAGVAVFSSLVTIHAFLQQLYARLSSQFLSSP